MTEFTLTYCVSLHRNSPVRENARGGRRARTPLSVSKKREREAESLRPSSQCAVTRGEGMDMSSPGCVEEEREREREGETERESPEKRWLKAERT